MNHNAFQWVEITILLGLGVERGMGWAGLDFGRAGLDGTGQEELHKW